MEPAYAESFVGESVFASAFALIGTALHLLWYCLAFALVVPAVCLHVGSFGTLCISILLSVMPFSFIV
jgi:hypothetical protein